ncbi:MAG: class I SAM-dependent methyltransferase, partial [Beijerinckiaceae bacterium]
RVLQLLSTLVSLPRLLATQGLRIARLEQAFGERTLAMETQLEASFCAAQAGLCDLRDALQELEASRHDNTVSIEALRSALALSDQAIEQLAQNFAQTIGEMKADKTVENLRRDLSQMRAEFAFSRARMQEDIRYTQRQGLQRGETAKPTPASPEQALSPTKETLNEIYLAFEEAFRGEQDTIRSRSERYIPLMPVTLAHTNLPVVDVGCGRGEWLLALREAGVFGYGVDLNASMLDAAKANALDVIEADAIAHLEGLAEGSLRAVTGFHIIEHLPFDILVRLLDASYKALAPGGVILFETPNPECLVVGGYTFHLDHTHIRPLPPALMLFLARQRGFADGRIIRQLSDIDLEQTPSVFEPKDVNDWFQQPLDYAVFARKQS